MEAEPSNSLLLPTAAMNTKGYQPSSYGIGLHPHTCKNYLLKYVSKSHICTSGENIWESSLAIHDSWLVELSCSLIEITVSHLPIPLSAHCNKHESKAPKHRGRRIIEGQSNKVIQLRYADWSLFASLLFSPTLHLFWFLQINSVQYTWLGRDSFKASAGWWHQAPPSNPTEVLFSHKGNFKKKDHNQKGNSEVSLIFLKSPEKADIQPYFSFPCRAIICSNYSLNVSSKS